MESKPEVEIARQQLFAPINPENSVSHLEKNFQIVFHMKN